MFFIITLLTSHLTPEMKSTLIQSTGLNGLFIELKTIISLKAFLNVIHSVQSKSLGKQVQLSS